ncbi:type II toxin-antitoxin system HipA family toxin [Microbacterium sp.]|uniref:type II toxin-antitoxin system HipA family toxin n=1 Tax=Microbacterium sp. TaxID=51671 RepID=UPI003A90AA99
MTDVAVYVDISGDSVPVGDLHSMVRHRRLSSTFSYAAPYLSHPRAYALEPALPLVLGPQHTAQGIPRSFQDAAPDRWGRNLIAKRERAVAARDKTPPRTLDDLDYLLGVADATRQGAMRFANAAGEEFQHPSNDVPKLIALPRLMRAADDAMADHPDESALKMLLDAGTGSLGGARPKASVTDGEQLLIAKFGHSADEWDVMRWEKTALELADKAGVEVSAASLVDIAGRAVLLVERFDRNHGHRVGYISVMTLLESDDGETSDYLDIADALAAVSTQPESDLPELWTRIALSIALHNTDDHLRNHGLLRMKGGWTLSPAFDINPDPETHARRTTIAGTDGPDDEARALVDAARLFGLTAENVRARMTRVINAVSEWPIRAQSNRISNAEIERFTPSFTAGLNALAAAVP